MPKSDAILPLFIVMDSEIRISAIDSHTGGEPTRVVHAGFPDLGGGTMAERLGVFRSNHDELRSAIASEPRAHNALVGALLCEPADPTAAAGVIFFNNVGYLGMCGHGTIGLVKTLEYMGRIGPGTHRIETPVGTVDATLNEDGSVTVANVPSFRHEASVSVRLDDGSSVTGDIAYGGNWFFLVRDCPLEIALGNLDSLTNYSAAVRNALERDGITGAGGAEIDHVELFGPSGVADSRNFVLCPGREYDRSPCGTGTSAKLACLYADGKLDEGQIWRQESIVGSIFKGSYRVDGDKLIPSITGSAFITAQVELILNPDDPFRFGCG